jgi:HAAS domain-containing protein
VISSYLDSLSAELRVPRRTRARILAETRDHLLEAVAAGQTEEEATNAFGDPRAVAARFHAQLASASARRASAQTVALMGAFVVAMTFAAFGSSNAFPFGVVAFIGAQLAAVAGAIGCVRWLRYRSGGLVPSARLADLYRANAVTVGAIAVVGVAELVNGLGSGRAGLAIGGGVILAAAVAVGLRVRAAAARARILPAVSRSEDALDDLVAVVPQLEAVTKWIPIRRNPWQVCLLFAAVCGVALAGWHGVVEASGPATVSNLGRALLAGFAIASIEAAAVVACFAAFGRVLGIRR